MKPIGTILPIFGKLGLLAFLFSLWGSTLARSESVYKEQSPSGQTDYAAGFNYRIQPLGSIFYVQGGYGMLLWDKRKTKSKSEFQYGYLRPQLRLESIFVESRIIPRMELFPISILGFYVQRSWIFKDSSKTQAFDCGQVTCRGSLITNELGIELKGGVGPVFALLRGQKIYYVGSKKDESIGDSNFMTVGTRDQDTALAGTGVVGYQFSPSWKAGLLAIRSKMRNSQNGVGTTVFFGGHRYRKWDFVFGLGWNNGRDRVEGASVVGQIQWNGKDSIGLGG